MAEHDREHHAENDAAPGASRDPRAPSARQGAASGGAGLPAAAAAAAAERIVPATVADLHTVLDQHARYWGERDLRALHLSAIVREFPATCLVAVADDGIRGYLLGFVTPDRVGYVHLIATRDDARGTGLGRRLYAAFIDAARARGALRLKAITSPANVGSVAFHRSLGFDAREVADYDGPGRPRVVFSRAIDEP